MSSATLLLLALLWLPERPFGQPASADELLRYVPDDAFLVVALDAGSVGDALLKNLDALGRERFVQGVPALRKGYEDVRRMRDEGLRELTEKFGIVLPQDLRYITLALVAGDEGDPEPLVVLGGQFEARMRERLAELGQGASPRAVGGGEIYAAAEAGPHAFAAAFVAQRGVALLGDPTLIERVLRAADKPARTHRGLGARLRAAFDNRTYLLVGFQPTATLMNVIRKERVPGPVEALLGGLRSGVLALRYHETLIELEAGDRALVPRYRALLAAMAALDRAGDALLTALEEVAVALVVPSDPGLEPETREAFRHRDAFLDFLKRHLAAPPNPARVDTQAAQNRVTLKASGSPLLVLLPAAVPFGYVMRL